MSARIPLFLSLTACAAANAAEPVDVSNLPPPATATIDFDRDVKPLFEKSCFQCHGPERPKSGFRLDNREAALKGGDNGVAIIPGKSAESPLVHYVAYLVEDMEMPPPKKAPRFTPEEIGLVRAWIDQGANWGAPAVEKMQFALTAGVRAFAISGDKNKFREHQWQSGNWAGGLEHLYLRDKTYGGAIATAEARAIVDEGDYLLKLRIEKPDLGYVQFGFEQFRRYTDDTGLAFPPYGMAGQTLGTGAGELDIGRSWIDFGLTLPDWPRMRVGYEHQYRDGTKHDLQFDFVSPDIGAEAQGRALLPGFRRIDEEVHIIKFDLDHEIAGLRIEDNFRGEFYAHRSLRQRNAFLAAGNLSGFNGALDRTENDHFQGANAFKLEKQVQPWLLLSGGYLFSRLDGAAEFSRELFVPANPVPPLRFLAEDTTGIVIGQDSHVFNANSQWGPWSGLSMYAALQSDWTRRRGFGSSLIQTALVAPTSPTTFSSDLSSVTFDERIGVRYSGLPATVMHLEGRFQQEETDHFESNFIGNGVDDDDDFMRDTDARAWLTEGRAGFTVSPWTVAAFSAEYKIRAKFTDYNHLLDTDPASLGVGYPGHINEREINSNEIEARVVLRPANWARITLKHEYIATDYRTDFAGSPEILSGNYDAHVSAVSVALNPWRRLRFSTTLSHTYSEIVSAIGNNPAIAPYDGHIYSLLSSATFVLNLKTDLHASYHFSKAGFEQSNFDGLPMGLDYDRHGVLTGVTYRIRDGLATKLQYGFFHYNEPTTFGVNDYDAHAVFASMTWSLH